MNPGDRVVTRRPIADSVPQGTLGTVREKQNRHGVVQVALYGLRTWSLFLSDLEPFSLFRASDFTEAYVACLLCTYAEAGRQPDHEDLMARAADLLSFRAIETIKKDCVRFQLEHKDLIVNHMAEAGHNFLLSRQGHGGFLDSLWPHEQSLVLEKSANKFPHLDLQPDDDGYLEFD